MRRPGPPAVPTLAAPLLPALLLPGCTTAGPQPAADPAFAADQRDLPLLFRHVLGFLAGLPSSKGR